MRERVESIEDTLFLNILIPRNHDSCKMETGLPVDGNQLTAA
jgi:hypothetical protein